MKKHPQVTPDHYRLERYVTYERWNSYFNQVRECLRYDPKNVLVIGPGDGIVVNILKGYGIEVTTVDIDENNKPDIICSVEDLITWIPEKKYDVVLCCQVLEHLPIDQLERCLENIQFVTNNVAIVSLPEKSLRTSLTFKPPIFPPMIFNFVIPFLWKKHSFDGEHYWELNSRGMSVSKIVKMMSQYFEVKKSYRLRTNPYHFFFVLRKHNKKRIFLLSEGRNPHTIKWARGLASQGYQIFIYSLTAFNTNIYDAYPNIQCAHAGFDESFNKIGDGALRKITYLRTLSHLKSCIKDFGPNILHAHFSSSYGLLGALTRFKPYMISVWGADVYDFPKRSFIHRWILRYNLSCADRLFSTSFVMAEETKKYTDKDIEVIPFGVDLEKFLPDSSFTPIFSKDSIVIGTIKALEDKYGVNILIRGFAQLCEKHPDLPLKLLIVGKGTKELVLKNLVRELGIEDRTVFTGFIPVETVPDYQNMLDIAVFPSILDSESFGVAVIEANACGKPVIVSNKGGLPEVVEDGVSGFIIPPNDVEALVAAMEKLVFDPHLRTQVGLRGRERIKRLYDWKSNLISMIKAYEKQL